MDNTQQKRRGNNGNRPPGATRETRAAKAQRSKRVLELLVSGLAVGDIIETLKKEFGATERTAYKDIQHVREKHLPKMYALTEIGVMRSEAIAKAEKLYMRCIADRKLDVALKTLQWIGELQGLRASQMIASGHHELREKLANLRSARMSGDRGRVETATKQVALTLDAFNQARAIYNMPPYSPEDFAEYRERCVQLQTAPPVPTAN